MELVQRFEELLNADGALEKAHYATDIDFHDDRTRAKFGVAPTSAVWPLEGDQLGRTRNCIPGLHWPYGYASDDEFGALFAVHREDYDLHSVNLLHMGEKVWIVIPPASLEEFEQHLRSSEAAKFSSSCSQFTRHAPVFVPMTVLDEWNIEYRTVHQRPNDVVITFARTYHEGFSTGRTIAEAVNYAPEDWNF